MPRIIPALALALLPFTPAAAQTWPTRPVTMVIAFAAGSSIDLVGRILAPRLSELLGQNVIVENVSGAAGIIGTSRVAKSPPDGYQLLLGAAGAMSQNQFLYKSLPAPIIQKLNEAIVATLNTPAVQARLFENGATVVAPERRSAEYLKTFLESETAKWGAAIKAAGITPE